MVTDDALIALAQHRFEQADRADATGEDCQQLRDIFRRSFSASAKRWRLRAIPSSPTPG